jgi:hypothetical protein
MDSLFFDSEFLKKIGVDKLPAEEQETVLANMQSAVFQSILLRAIDQLDDEQQTALNGLIKEDDEDQEEAYKFLSENVPHLPLISSEEVDKFKGETLDFLNSLQAPAA